MHYLILLFVVVTSPLWAMSKETSERVCQTNIETLQSAQSSLTGDMQQAFSFVLTQMRDDLEKLKRSGKHEDIYNYRSSCDKGYHAALWMMESSGISLKDRVKREEIKADKEKPVDVKEKSESEKSDTPSVKTSAQTVSLKKKPTKVSKEPSKKITKVSHRTEKKKAHVKDAKSSSTIA